jgi:choline kinase
MKDLTGNRPKGLVELRGKALLDWQLLALQEAGIEETAIITGYRRELFAERGLREFHNPRWAETNMVSSLACAEEWLSTETCIVSYSDIFYDTQAVKLLMESQTALAVTYDPNWLELWRRRFADPLVDAETFRLNSDDTLAEIGGKPNSIEEVQGQYMGLLRFMPTAWMEIRRILDRLPRSECDRMHMTGTLQKVIEVGNVPVAAIPYFGEWGEVDSGEDLAMYNELSNYCVKGRPVA